MINNKWKFTVSKNIRLLLVVAVTDAVGCYYCSSDFFFFIYLLLLYFLINCCCDCCCWNWSCSSCCWCYFGLGQNGCWGRRLSVFGFYFIFFFKSRRINGDLIKAEFDFWIFFLVWCLFFNDDCGKTVSQSIERIKRQVIPFVIFLYMISLTI